MGYDPQSGSDLFRKFRMRTGAFGRYQQSQLNLDFTENYSQAVLDARQINFTKDFLFDHVISEYLIKISADNNAIQALHVDAKENGLSELTINSVLTKNQLELLVKACKCLGWVFPNLEEN